MELPDISEGLLASDYDKLPVLSWKQFEDMLASERRGIDESRLIEPPSVLERVGKSSGSVVIRNLPDTLIQYITDPDETKNNYLYVIFAEKLAPPLEFLIKKFSEIRRDPECRNVRIARVYIIEEEDCIPKLFTFYKIKYMPATVRFINGIQTSTFFGSDPQWFRNFLKGEDYITK